MAAFGVLGLALSGCSDSSTPASGAKKTGKDVTVGFSVYDMQYQYFQKMEQGTRKAAEAKGWKFKLHDEKSDENEMVTGAQALLDQGVDMLIISPFKPDALGPIVAKAKQKHIPVIINDIGGGGTPYDAIVISDNANGGTQAADFMAQQIEANGAKSKKVVSITCEPSAVYAARRNEAFDKEIKAKGYQVVTELSGNSKAEEAYKIMKDALAKDPDVAGMFGRGRRQCHQGRPQGPGQRHRHRGLQRRPGGDHRDQQGGTVRDHRAGPRSDGREDGDVGSRRAGRQETAV
jgi:ribose transport system substrate-binding protein